MKYLSLLAAAFLLVGCVTPNGCGQRALLDYSNIVAPNKVTIEQINGLLHEHFTSMYDLKKTAIKLGYNCEAKMFENPEEFKKYSGYAILLIKASREKKTENHFVLVHAKDGEVYLVDGKKEKFLSLKRDWQGVVLLLSA